MAEALCEVAPAEPRAKRSEEVSARARRRQWKRRRVEGDRPELRRHGVASVCGRRRSMEDAVSLRPGLVSGLDYYGVFDGHGCSHVALLCGSRMHQVVAEEVGGGEAGSGREYWEEVMGRSFARVDAEAAEWPLAGKGLRCGCERLQAMKLDHVGSTAVLAVVSDREIVVANCGDSRAVLCRGGAAVPLSSDHKPDRPDELRRIQEAGGKVIYWDGARVFGVLAMSRALGDKNLKPYVTAEPEVTVAEREDDDEFLIVASDGLWDVVSNATACELVRARVRRAGAVTGKACAEAAMLLAELAMARGSSDNITALVVDVQRR